MIILRQKQFGLFSGIFGKSKEDLAKEALGEDIYSKIKDLLYYISNNSYKDYLTWAKQKDHLNYELATKPRDYGDELIYYLEYPLILQEGIFRPGKLEVKNNKITLYDICTEFGDDIEERNELFYDINSKSFKVQYTSGREESGKDINWVKNITIKCLNKFNCLKETEAIDSYESNEYNEISKQMSQRLLMDFRSINKSINTYRNELVNVFKTYL